MTEIPDIITNNFRVVKSKSMITIFSVNTEVNFFESNVIEVRNYTEKNEVDIVFMKGGYITLNLLTKKITTNIV